MHSCYFQKSTQVSCFKEDFWLMWRSMRRGRNQKVTESQILRHGVTFLKKHQCTATLSMHSADSQGFSSFHLGKVDIPLEQVFLGRKNSTQKKWNMAGMPWFPIEESAESNGLPRLRGKRKKTYMKNLKVKNPTILRCSAWKIRILLTLNLLYLLCIPLQRTPS